MGEYGSGSKRPRGNGRWEFRVSHRGEVHTTSWPGRDQPPEPSAKAAEKAKTAWVSDVIKGNVVAGRQMTMAKLLNGYLDDVAMRLSPDTLAGYRKIVDSRLTPAIGNVRVQALTRDHLNKLYRSMAKADEKRLRAKAGLAASTINQAHAIVSGALKDAVMNGWVSRNVAKDTRRPAVRQKDIHLPSPEEVQKLVLNAEWPMDVLIQTAAMTGMRRGELAALRWKRVDLETGVITVSHSLDSRSIEKDTKSHQTRLAPMHPALVQILKAHRERQGGGPEGFVFSPAPEVPVSPDWITRSFVIVREAAGVSCRFHDLRHFCFTYMAQGGDLRMVQSLAGHASITTTNRYLHVLPAGAQEAAARVAAVLT